MLYNSYLTLKIRFKVQLKPDILAAGQKSTRLFPAPDAATPEANRNNPNDWKRVILIIMAYVALLQVKNAGKRHGKEQSMAKDKRGRKLPKGIRQKKDEFEGRFMYAG